MKIVVVSGGFDPLHSGHIAYFKAAKKLGDKLVVALNSDEWLTAKKGKYFMPYKERSEIISHLTMIDNVIDFEDDGFGSCALGLTKVLQMYPNDQIIFANGGDRNEGNIHEMGVEGVEFVFSVGGDDKKNSSSWILKEYKYDSEDRLWGKFYNLFTDDVLKVKELIIFPKKGLSFQRHQYRSEIFFVSKGSCLINYSEGLPEEAKALQFSKNEIFVVKKNAWHQLINLNETPCHLIEIQYGKKTSEDDIERLRYYEKND
jgi:cytidyltransferase-like protein